MIQGLIVDADNDLSFKSLESVNISEYRFISVFAEKLDFVKNRCLSPKSDVKLNIRCNFAPENLSAAISARPHSVTIVADKEHILEYSFGVDVLKFKPQIREIINCCHNYNIKCGVSTDFRHENILHAGDCGADFVEIDYNQYDNNIEQYKLTEEILKERDLDLIKKEKNTLTYFKLQ